MLSMYRSANVCAKATASFLSRAVIGVLLVVVGAQSAMASDAADAAAAPPEAPAQSTSIPTSPSPSTSSSELETIIVTAQKREENQQNVPISISTITAKAIEDAHTVNLEALTGSIPNVQIGNFSNNPQSAVFSIRGMYVSDPDPYAGQTVTVVQDGVPLVFNMISLPTLFDIDRIEVLKGPQGTLFGANTIGGVVNIVTAQPTGEYDGKAEVTLGNFNRVDGSVALNFPIADDLAGKVTFMHHGQYGYVTNIVDGQPMGDQDDSDARVYLKWTPSDTFNATLIQEYDQLRDGSPVVVAGDVPGDAEYVPAGTVFSGSVLPMYQSPCFPAGTICRAPNTYYSASDGVPDQENADLYATTLTANWKSPIGDIVSITGYRRFIDNNYTDQDGTPKFEDATNRISGGSQISEEVRDSFKPTDKLQLMIGTFEIYDHYKLEQNYLIQFAEPGYSQIILENESTRSESLFVQSYYDITDQLRFQAGLRGTSETTEMTANTLNFLNPSGVAAFTGGVPIPGSFVANGERTWNNVGGKTGFDYKWTPDVMDYLYYARGFKSGGYTGRLSEPTDIGPFDPEYVDTIELGLKADWLEHTLRTNLAIFYNKYHNLQLTEIYFAKNSTGQTVNGNSIVNAAQAKTQGVELDVTWLPIESLKINLSGGYLDATYTNFPYRETATTTIDLDGQTLQDAPEFSGNAGFLYTLPWGPGKTALGLQDRYVGRNYENSILATARSQIQATNYVDGTLDFTSADARWGVGLWVRDMLDKHYIASVYDAPGTLGLVNYAPPREWGATFRYKW
jgi:iron complex outermembrane recepter protein